MATIERLSRSTARSTAEVLASSFADYPFLARAFDGGTKPRAELIRAMFDIGVDYRLALNIPSFVAIDQGRVLGAATLSVPNAPELPQEFLDRWEGLAACQTPDGRAVFQAYQAMQEEVKPAEPHVYLVAIGVLPDFHGRGVGRALIETVRSYALELSGVHGVALDTHDPANVPKYLKLGFKLIAERVLLGMPTWFFWDGDLLTP